METLRKPFAETMWAIMGQWDTGRVFLYTGTWLTRHEAICAHTFNGKLKWSVCRARGDRAIKVSVVPL